MRVKSLLTESYECVKIGGILRNLSNDEMKIYKKVKEEGKVFKQDLDEYDANVATTMVSKGLLKRKKLKDPNDKKHNGMIYYTTIGRKGHLVRKAMDEVAPPGQEAEKWIKKNKKRFKDKYGKDYEKYLYGKAWNNYNGKKKLSESVSNMNSFISDFKYIYEKCLDEQKTLLSDNTNLGFERSFCAVYNEFARFLDDYLYDFNRHRDDDSKTGKIYHLLDTMMDRNNDLWSSMRDDAQSDGDYAVYQDDTYNAEQTHQNMYDYGFPETISKYIDSDIAWRWFASQTADVAQAAANLEESLTEPEFNGNFDDVNQERVTNLKDSDKETIEQCKKFIQLVNDNKETPEKCMEYLDEMYNSYSNEILDTARSNIIEKLYDYVDENLSGETDYDIISVTKGEFDDDATWEAIMDISFEDLVDRFLNKSEALDFMNNVIDDLEDLKEVLEKDNSNEPIPDESGSEYDE